MATRYDDERRPLRRAAARLAALAGGVLGLLALTVPSALAHITITPSTAETGSTAELTLRVPNEEAHAATTRVSVLIPTAHPIAQLLAKPVPGWKVTIRSKHLAQPLVTDDGTFHSVVSQVTWSGGRIGPGQYQDFSLSADPLPDTPTTLVFKTLQGYSNGDVVRWIDVPQNEQPEPEHPAPVLIVAQAAADPSSMPGMTSSGSVSQTSDGSGGEGVGWVALGVSIIALLLAGGTFVAARRRS